MWVEARSVFEIGGDGTEQGGGGFAAGLGGGAVADGDVAEGVGGVGGGLPVDEAISDGVDVVGGVDEPADFRGFEEVGQGDGVEAEVVAELGGGEAGVGEEVEHVGVCERAGRWAGGRAVILLRRVGPGRIRRAGAGGVSPMVRGLIGAAGEVGGERVEDLVCRDHADMIRGRRRVARGFGWGDGKMRARAGDRGGF